MTTEMLHRIQFGLTISFHFIFPPMSLGVGLILVILGIKSVRTGDPKWRQLSLFWVRIYGLIFAMGIATGIVQEFQFGTNWSEYSRFVGNIFGALLAAEGIFAFMLEGGFLGLMLFGGSRLGNKMWLFATTMVVTGATFSATWIVMAKTTFGYEMRAVGHNPNAARFAGIPVNRVLMKTALLSGGLAALAGFSEVAGLKGNLTLDLSPGYGYTGIVVAMLAMLNPLGVVASAIFVAGIFVGADAMSRSAGVPSYIAQVMVATALLTMVAAIMLSRYRIRWR